MAEPPRIHRAGLEVRDEDVGRLDEAKEGLATALVAKVEREAALASVARDEERAAEVALRGSDRQPAGLVADVRQLDLDHLGAEQPERRRGLWPLHEKAGLDDPYALERGHSELHPPSSVTAAPFTLLASSHASHEMSVAISSGFAMRVAAPSNGIHRIMCSGSRGTAVDPMPVSTPPGQTALHRTPSGP